jgi:carboxyl-terminal processing protease
LRPGGEGEVREVTLERTRVRLPAVRGARMLKDRMLEGEDGVGYLRLAAFKSGAEKELREAVADLAGRGARRLILDLRDNPGGSLLDAIGAAGVFLDGGRVLRTRGRMLGADWAYNVPLLARPAWSGPLAVLVNEDTASAAEVLAAALARRGRARLVGRRTYGKGAAQITLAIAGTDTALCLTVARVYDPDGACLEGAGLAPDRHVDAPAEPPARLEDDPVVRAAVEVLRAEETAPP